MATNDIKRIGKNGPQVQHQHSNAWQVMKPFVHFGVKAISAIAIPKPDSPKPSGQKGGKIIKI